MEASNMQAMREALSKFCAYSAVALNIRMFNEAHLETLLNMAKAALAAPARNCDVGTVEEQINRHYRYCSCRLGDGDDPHGCGHISCSECVLSWAQMEYKEEAK